MFTRLLQYFLLTNAMNFVNSYKTIHASTMFGPGQTWTSSYSRCEKKQNKRVDNVYILSHAYWRKSRVRVLELLTSWSR
jgi:hypothetical protein